MRGKKIIHKWKTDYNVAITELSPEQDEIARSAGRTAREEFIISEEARGNAVRQTWEYYQKAQQGYVEEVKEEGYPWERK